MKLQLKRSSTTTGNVNAVVPVGPTAAQTLPGELCVNFNSGDPALFIEDTAGNIVRVDGNNDTYALSTTSNGSQGDIVLTHDGSGNNAATTDTVSILAGTNIAVSSDGTDITIASSVPSSGQFGYWTRNDGTDTLSPVNTNDNVNIGSGQFTTSVGYNGPLLTNNGSDLTVSTAGTGNNNIHLDTVGTGQVQINTDVVIENEHSLILKELETNGYHEVAHKAASSLTEDATYAWPITPTASAYLTSDASGNLSWTTGTTILTTVVGGAGLDATGTSGSSTTVSVDLKANQGLRTIDSGSLADATDDDSELGLISGSNPQDTLLWTVTNGARELVESGGEVVVSGNTAQPQGTYVAVATEATTGSGCTINFDADSSGVITNLTIANPGSGYGESEVLTIVGHQTEGPSPADITFTLETDANNGRYTYTGWRTGALTVGGGGGSGGDVVGIDGGPGIEIDESNTTTPKVSIDLASEPGLEFSTDGDTGELQVKNYHGIAVNSNGVSAVGNQGISVDSAGISVDLASNSGLQFTGTAPNEELSVDSGLGIEVNGDGVNTKMHTGGGLVNNLGTNADELGLSNGSASNQVMMWSMAGAVDTIAVSSDANHNTSDQPEGTYFNVPTTNPVTDPVTPGSGLTVNFTVGASGAITNLTVANPGQGYTNTAGQNTLNVTGHDGFSGDPNTELQVVISAVIADAGWSVKNLPSGGGSGGGGDVTNVVGGQGITVDTSAGPDPEVSFAPTTDGGLEFSDNTDDATVGVDLGASAISGTVAIDHGGTGLTAAPTNGQLLIGNGTGYTLATLTEGTNIVITEDAGSITIATGETTAQGSGVFQLNQQTVTADYTIPNGYNAVSAGPITINDGVTVTVDDGEHWSIV